MLKKYIELFRGHNLLDEAISMILQMLDIDSNMFQIAQKSLRESDTAEMQDDIRAMDRQVNKYHREVRRKVLTHLTVTGTTNLVPGLVLASIVIDVERIGDYAKNIVDLARHHPERLHGQEYEIEMKEIEEVVALNLDRVVLALSKQDILVGRKVMDIEQRTGKLCDVILNELLTCPSKKLSGQDIACIALYIRFLKRTNAHLTNVASAIVNPFPRIGFSEKRNRPSKP
jgi:phosphate transport system protein